MTNISVMIVAFTDSRSGYLLINAESLLPLSSWFRLIMNSLYRPSFLSAMWVGNIPWRHCNFNMQDACNKREYVQDYAVG